ncbi:hypothetical protein [Sporosarcina sp. FA9]|uniref:hypothetical protein n=1 Tax=Sporosarcina sp. FA9 TaxID=3413030 RepID=UPI003F65F141
MTLKVKDRVTVLNNQGDSVGVGIIVNINEFREPKFKYAVDTDFYKEDYLFVGEENLLKIQEES